MLLTLLTPPQQMAMISHRLMPAAVLTERRVLETVTLGERILFIGVDLSLDNGFVVEIVNLEI